jgi:cob(I)alamin adenosyltransferase
MSCHAKRLQEYRPSSGSAPSTFSARSLSLGTELALPSGTTTSAATTLLGTQDIHRLERAIDSTEAQLPPLKHLVVPGGCAQAVALHQGRVMCRRRERALLALDDLPPRHEVVAYLNRLGDLLFVLARRANAAAGVQEVPWRPTLQATSETKS